MVEGETPRDEAATREVPQRAAAHRKRGNSASEGYSRAGGEKDTGKMAAKEGEEVALERNLGNRRSVLGFHLEGR